MKRLRSLLLSLLGLMVSGAAAQQGVFLPGQPWPDAKGEHINAHGGGVLLHEGRYYWYGENRPDRGFTTEKGVEVYSSADLYHWTDEGVALAVSAEAGNPIEKGCIMERPKVVYNPRTRQFVMLFHLELKGRGYEAARVGFAVSDTPTGPFRFVRSLRPNAERWPVEFGRREVRQARKLRTEDYKEWWTPAWRKAIEKGMFTARDFEGGQMSRDMTVYVDDDEKAYHIFSSEDNLTLHMAELTDDFLDYTGRYTRIVPGGQNEAPTLFKRNGKYWLIASGCTGWEPNRARMFCAPSLWGPWEQLPSPFEGEGADRTFGGQGTYILKVPGHEDGFIFMADIWNPRHLRRSRHIWLPIEFREDGTPVIPWRDRWTLDDLK